MKLVFAILLFLAPIFGHARPDDVETLQSMHCLVLDPQTKRPITGKYIDIEKWRYDSGQIVWQTTVGIHGSGSYDDVDYGTVINEVKSGSFYFSGYPIDELKIQVTNASYINFKHPEKMEPFFIGYSFDSEFLEIHDKLQAKCLHIKF